MTAPGDQALRARAEGALEEVEAGVALLAAIDRFVTEGKDDPRGREALADVLGRLVSAEATVRRLLEQEPAPSVASTLEKLDRAREAAMTSAAARLERLGVEVPTALSARLVAACLSREVLFDRPWTGVPALLLELGAWPVLLLGSLAWLAADLAPLAGGAVLGTAALLRGGWQVYRRVGPRVVVTGLGVHASRRFWPFEALWEAWSVSLGVVAVTKSHHEVRLKTRQSAELQQALRQRGVTLTTRDLRRLPKGPREPGAGP